MNKTIIILILSCCVLVFFGCGKKAPDASVFINPKSYGGSMYDSARDLTVTAKGFFFAGMTNSTGTGGINAWTGMIGPDGKLLWENTFGETGDDRFYGVSVMNSGLLAAAGYINYSNEKRQDALLVLLSETGKAVAVRNYGGNGIEDIRGITACSDGGIVLCGSSDTYSSVPGKSEGYILKTDGSGRELWSTVYGNNTKNLIFNSVVETEEGYLAAGRVLDIKRGTKGILVSFTREGKFIWEKRYGAAGFNSFNGVALTGDGIIVAGEFDTGNRERTVDAWLVSTDKKGGILWERTFGWINPDRFDRVMANSDGTAIASGITESFGNGSSDIYIVKVDKEGNSLWAKYLGGRKDEYMGNLARTGKNTYVAGGWSATYGTGEYDAWFAGFKAD